MTWHAREGLQCLFFRVLAPFWFDQRRTPNHSSGTVRLAFMITPSYFALRPRSSSRPSPWPTGSLPTIRSRGVADVYEGERDHKKTINVFPPSPVSHIPPFVPFAAAGLGRKATLIPVATDRPPRLSAAHPLHKTRQPLPTSTCGSVYRTRAFQDARLFIIAIGPLRIHTTHWYPPTWSISASDCAFVPGGNCRRFQDEHVASPSPRCHLPRPSRGERAGRWACTGTLALCCNALPHEGGHANKHTRKTLLNAHAVWHFAYLHLHSINVVSPSSEARMPAATYLLPPSASFTRYFRCRDIHPRSRLAWGYTKDDIETPAARHWRSAFLSSLACPATLMDRIQTPRARRRLRSHTCTTRALLAHFS
ncbi:hypothetical protein R3P38DRAFT_3175388 [Favolaschia claudopus]|uniref:Uncharacterized protein n=1 Tax=Favolaschia claudopus TaxID=2862362 RepID=A0AAW0DDQ7_9AGAR